MFRSIRWRLLVWHAGILILTVAGFGAVLYFQIRHARLHEVDAELQASARALEGTLRVLPDRALDALREPSPSYPDGPPFDPSFHDPGDHGWPPPGDHGWPPGDHGKPPPGDHGNPPFSRPGDSGKSSGDPGRGPMPPRGDRGKPPPQRELLEGALGALTLPSEFTQRYREEAAPYFVVWLDKSKALKESPRPAEVAAPEFDTTLGDNPGQLQTRQRGPVREAIIAGKHGTQVLVGRSIQRELAELTALAWQLVLTGLGVLTIGLAGGFFLSMRAVRPIAAMSSAAAGISAANLSQRINVREVDSELGDLASILNEMFGRLEGAFERQARFTADASHELRTPLAVMLSCAELALSRPRDAADYQQTLDTCVRASRRMKSIIEGLLTLARADAGKLELHREPLDLGELVRDAVAMLEPLAAQRNVNLSVEAGDLELTGDVTRLAQVVTNLLSNAINYNRPGGSVQVTLEASGQEVAIAVADTGCGIPDEDRPHIFERFYRVDKARSREPGGSGLGLAICTSIIQAHGGSITFTSELNQGTTFVVHLPLDRVKPQLERTVA